MKSLIFLLLFATSLVWAGSVEDQAVDLIRSLIPHGNQVVYKGTLTSFSEPCEFTINYSDLSGVPMGYREVYGFLSARNNGVFAKFDVSTMASEYQKIKPPEGNAAKFKIIKFYREHNNYSPWQQQIVTVIRNSTGGISYAGIIMAYSVNGSINGPYKTTRQVSCKF